MAITNPRDLLRDSETAPLLLADATHITAQHLKEVAVTTPLVLLDETVIPLENICLFDYIELLARLSVLLAQNKLFFESYNIVTYRVNESTGFTCFDENGIEQNCDCAVVENKNNTVVDSSGYESIIANFKRLLQGISFTTHSSQLSHNLPAVHFPRFAEKIPYLSESSIIFPLGRGNNVGYTSHTYLRKTQDFFNSRADIYDYVFTSPLETDSSTLNPLNSWPKGYSSGAPVIFSGSRATTNQKENLCTAITGSLDAAEDTELANPLNAKDCKKFTITSTAEATTINLACNLTSGKVYTLSFYARVLTEGRQAFVTANVGSTVFYPENYSVQITDQNKYNRLTPDWHRYYITFSPSGAITNIALNFVLSIQQNVQAKIAGVLLEEASQPSAYNVKYCDLGSRKPEQVLFYPLAFTTYSRLYPVTTLNSWTVVYKKYIEDATFLNEHVDSLNDITWGIYREGNTVSWKIKLEETTRVADLTSYISRLRDRWLTIFLSYKNNSFTACLYDNCTKLAEVSIVCSSPFKKDENYGYSYCFHSDDPYVITGNNYYRRLPYSLLLGGQSVAESIEGPIDSNTMEYLKYSHLDRLSEDAYRDVLLTDYVTDTDAFQRSVLAETYMDNDSSEYTMRSSFLLESPWDTKVLFNSII